MPCQDVHHCTFPTSGQDYHQWLKILIEKNLTLLGHVHRMHKNRLPKQLLYSQLCLRIRSQGRPRLKLKNDAKRNMKWRDIELNRWLEMREGECQQQTYQEKTYQTVLNPRTVSVEPTDCNDDEWNSFRKKSCCVLRNELIAKSFISSSHGSVREAVKEIQDIKACRAWVYFMG